MQTPSQKSTPKTRVALWIVFSIMLMDIIGLLLLAPVAAYIVQRYSDDALMVTMITVLYAAAQFFAAPLMGKLGDRYGRRPVLLVSLVGQAIGYAIFGLGGALWVLFVGRVIGGITGGNLSTASAYIADVSSPQERAKNFTLIGIAWSMGLILGPAIGAVFGQFSLEAPAFAAAVISLANVALTWFLLPESLPVEKRDASPMQAKDFNPIVSIFEMAVKPGLGRILLVTALFNFAFNGISSTNGLFLIDKFQIQPLELGSLMAGSGVALAVVQFWLVQRLAPRLGEALLAAISLIGLALGYTGIFLAPILWLVYVVYVFSSTMSGFTWPTLTTLNTNCVQPREVGLLMGVTTAIGSLTNMIGPVWAGLVYDHVMPGAAHWMGAVIFLMAAALLIPLLRRRGKPAEFAPSITPLIDPAKISPE